MPARKSNKKSLKNNTQKAVAGNILKELAVNVTEQDRKDFNTEVKQVSKGTMVAYLKGDVRNTDLALSMIKFFRARIEERQEELMQYQD